MAITDELEADALEAHDRKLCWIYGKQSKEFFPDKSWAEVESILQLGWERIRRDSKIDWVQAKAHVRAAWEG